MNGTSLQANHDMVRRFSAGLDLAVGHALAVVAERIAENGPKRIYLPDPVEFIRRCGSESFVDRVRAIVEEEALLYFVTERDTAEPWEEFDSPTQLAVYRQILCAAPFDRKVDRFEDFAELKADEPVEVILMRNGGCLHGAWSDRPVNVTVLDPDIEGADEDELARCLPPWSTETQTHYVLGLAAEVEPDAVRETLISLMPGAGRNG